MSCIKELVAMNHGLVMKKRTSCKINNIALLAEDPLVQVGLYHLLTETAHPVTVITPNELWLAMFHTSPSFSHVIIFASSLDVLRLLPLMVKKWPSINKIILQPANQRQWWGVNTYATQSVNTTVLPINSSLESLASTLFYAIKHFPIHIDSTTLTKEVSAKDSFADPLITRLHQLTKTECKVMTLLLKELPPSKVSRILQRDVRTISTHKQNAMKKLHVSGAFGLHSLLVHPSFVCELNSCLAGIRN